MKFSASTVLKNANAKNLWIIRSMNKKGKTKPYTSSFNDVFLPVLKLLTFEHDLNAIVQFYYKKLENLR